MEMKKFEVRKYYNGKPRYIEAEVGLRKDIAGNFELRTYLRGDEWPTTILIPSEQKEEFKQYVLKILES